MRLRLAAVLVLVLAMAACSVASGGGTATTRAGQATSQPVPTTAWQANSEWYTDEGRLIGGQFVRLDLETLTPVSTAEPIPFPMGSWHLTSDDGEWMVIFDWAKVSPVEVSTWSVTGSFEVPSHSARIVHDERLFLYTDATGEMRALDLHNGEVATIGRWPPGLWLYDGWKVLPNGRIAAIAPATSKASHQPVEYSAYVLDQATAATDEFELGPIERGDVQPATAWGDDRLFIVYGDVPEVIVVDLRTGEKETHSFDLTSWVDRLMAFWTPAASAKGPSYGTYTNAALSPDGRFLLISSHRYEAKVTEDGGVQEEEIPLGLTVLDTESWQQVDQLDLPIRLVRTGRATIFGVATGSTSSWVEDLYTLSVDSEGTVSYLGPYSVEGGDCQAATFRLRMICVEYVTDTTKRFNMLDMRTGRITAGPEIEGTTQVEPNGVLVDWRPMSDLSG